MEIDIMRKRALMVLAACAALTGCNKAVVAKAPTTASASVESTVAESTAEESTAESTEESTEAHEKPVSKEGVGSMNYEAVLQLYNKGVDKSKNWCFSPYSLLDCMSLVATDVQGGTAEEFKLLGLDNYNVFAEYDKNIPDGLSISNRVYVNEGKADKLDTSYVREGSDFEVLPFDQAAQDLINKNVSEDTHGKIPSIIDEIQPDAVSYFVNAVYFNNKWDWEADDVYWTPDDSWRAGFHGELPVSDVKELSDKVDMARLAYPGTDFAMYILVPSEDSTSDDLDSFMERGFDFDMLSPDKSSPFDEAYFRMPSFEYDSTPAVQSALLDCGIKESFSDRADFGRLGNIKIGSIIQKTYIKVNNKGTEAAASTAMIAETSALAPVVAKSKYVIADDPFVYVIKDEQSGMVLFMGRVADPVGENE